MAHLTTLTRYNIEDSNIALLGSDLEKHVREHAGDKEPAWDDAGKAPGVQIWRIEHFKVVAWPQERYGSFYDGDSYIVLHTYKKSPDAEELAYDLHFWLGSETTQDEAGTAAYKTVELDDHLHEAAVQYREVEGYESSKFLSYFPKFTCMHGGISTGFHHVSSLPPPDEHRLYRINLSGRSNLVIHQVPAVRESLVEGDVFVLDKGTKIWQFNSKESVGKEKFKAAEFVQSLMADRESQAEVTVFDEGGHSGGIFLGEFGEDAVTSPLPRKEQIAQGELPKPDLYRLTLSEDGEIDFESVPLTPVSSLDTNDAYLLDDSSQVAHPAIYLWLGKASSTGERRIALQYGQNFLHKKHDARDEKKTHVAITLVKMNEGQETAAFTKALEQDI